MKIISMPPAGLFSVNSYLIVSESGNAALIDCPRGGRSILNTIEKCGARLTKIFLTHGHCDHIEALAMLARETGAEVFIHELDKPKLTDDFLNLSEYFSDYMDCAAEHYDGAVTTAADGDEIALDEIKIGVIHTPGHTSGGVCYVTDGNMFSGDTLFCNSIGRTDMTDGNMVDLMKSLRYLSEISQNYALYPGHGSKTTLDAEKINNPYLKGTSYDDML